MMPSPHNIRREVGTKRSEHLEADGGLKQCFCPILCSQHPTGTDEAEKNCNLLEEVGECLDLLGAKTPALRQVLTHVSPDKDGLPDRTIG
ncbi:hypothetical protein C0Q70_13288 [Pomacea canaliculata]|uniref:Uncharacterized protein n=1 Tax=Pomacea canaliculata TaxID=400727 RepID=A0A2T7NWT1_POMCA|nr:hypothetical protein C0Q70_13288 [Pomacea canaliculata]